MLLLQGLLRRHREEQQRPQQQRRRQQSPERSWEAQDGADDRHRARRTGAKRGAGEPRRAGGRPTGRSVLWIRPDSAPEWLSCEQRVSVGEGFAEDMREDGHVKGDEARRHLSHLLGEVCLGGGQMVYISYITWPTLVLFYYTPSFHGNIGNTTTNPNTNITATNNHEWVPENGDRAPHPFPSPLSSSFFHPSNSFSRAQPSSPKPSLQEKGGS